MGTADPAAINAPLTSIVEIKRFLENWRDDQWLNLGQFCKDWIEETLEQIETILEDEVITTDDETFRGAVSYRAENILEVLAPRTDCHEFFFQLRMRTR